jgi:hypothetical protein
VYKFLIAVITTKSSPEYLTRTFANLSLIRADDHFTFDVSLFATKLGSNLIGSIVKYQESSL